MTLRFFKLSVQQLFISTFSSRMARDYRGEGQQWSEWTVASIFSPLFFHNLSSQLSLLSPLPHSPSLPLTTVWPKPRLDLDYDQGHSRKINPIVSESFSKLTHSFPNTALKLHYLSLSTTFNINTASQCVPGSQYVLVPCMCFSQIDMPFLCLPTQALVRQRIRNQCLCLQPSR